MTYWPGGGGGSTPAGNYGNLQLNRNGAFDTPASDSLGYTTSGGLAVKNKIEVTGAGSIGIRAASGNSTFTMTSPNGSYIRTLTWDNSAFLIDDISAGGRYIRVAGNGVLSMDGSNNIFNGGNLNQNFSVGSQGGANSLYVEGTTGEVGVGTNSPSTSLDVVGVVSTDGLNLDRTITTAGTTGNQTINKVAGTVNIAAAGTTVTVTNSLVTANSIIFCTLRTNDATATIKNVVPGAGSFVITLGSAATAEVSIGFMVTN